jgi:serine/threonine protein phosphatase 1
MTNRYAIADIHGGNRTFRALVNTLRLRHSDRLYLLGDYIDRGPDSKGVLEAIMTLQSAGYDVRPVRGNHDDMLLRNLKDDHDEYSQYWEKLWGKKTLRSFGVADCRDIPIAYKNLLENMPLLQSDADFVYVHASLTMTLADPLTETTAYEMLWGAVETVDRHKLGERRLVTGHKIRKRSQIEAALATDHIFLDNGACTNFPPEHGNLLALNLDTMELIAQPWLDGKAFD